MKKFLAILLSLLMCVVSVGSSSAEEYKTDNPYFTNKFSIQTEDDLRITYDFIYNESVILLSNSAGKIKVSVSFDTYETMQKLGFSSLELQQSSGVNWVTQSTVTNQFEFNTDSFDYDKTFSNLSSGYHYRVKITLYARRAPGEVQTITKTSDSIICH